mgnify:CR=1 FL=1
MFYKMTLEDKVRVPPSRLWDKEIKNEQDNLDYLDHIKVVVLDVLQEQLEGSIDKAIGIYIAVTKICEIGEGDIIPGDGGVYYSVTFEAIVLRLAHQEVIEGVVVETTSFGAFVSLGPIDAMLHVSQISDDYINYDEKNGMLICQDTQRQIRAGDGLRGRVVALSLSEREPRESKIGLTMRQSGLGTTTWLDEEFEAEQAEHGA